MEGHREFEKAKQRTKDRGAAYGRVMLLGGLGLVGLNIIGFGIIFAISFIGATLGAKAALALVQLVLGLALIVFNLYAGSLLYLTLIQILIQPIRQDVRTTLAGVKPLLKRFYYYATVTFLFLLLVTPIDIIISRFLVLPFIGILWALWSSFSIYVFLEKRKKGLANLWTSRAIFNSNWFSFLVRIIGINILKGVAQGVGVLPVLAAAFIGSLAMGSLKGIAGVAIMIILVAVAGALCLFYMLIIEVFVAAYNYELYAASTEPSVIRKPKEWFLIGPAGIIIGIVLVIMYPQQSMDQIRGYLGHRESSSTNKVSFSSKPDKTEQLKTTLETTEAGSLKRQIDLLSLNYLLEAQDKGIECNKTRIGTSDDTIYTICKKSYWNLYGLPGNFDTEVATIYDTFIKNGWWLSVRDSSDYFDRTSAISYITGIWSLWGKLEGERLAFDKGGNKALVSFASADMARLMEAQGTYVTCIDDPRCKLVKKYAGKYKTFVIVEMYTDISDPSRPSALPSAPVEASPSATP